MITMQSENRLTKLVTSLGVLVLLLASAIAIRGQEQSQYDHGTPPQHAAGVSAIGSYISADLGTVNLSNGSLNFKLPLGTVGGRGFSLPLFLNYNNKIWSASMSTDVDFDAGGSGQRYPVVYAVYDDPEAGLDIYQRVAAGWTIGAVPILRVRGIGIYSINNPNGCTDYQNVLVKLTLLLPDKGEIELRDDLTDGEPSGGYADSNGCRAMSAYRGRRWHATDGSGTVFISDVDNGVVNGDINGTVIAGDGTRYRFANTSPPFGSSAYLRGLARATSVTDRNGNVLNINYPSSTEVQYVDQLGRSTTIDFNAQDPDTGQLLAVLITLPGYGRHNRYYKIKTDIMSEHYRGDINPTLPVMSGDSDPLGYGYGYPGPHTTLFPQSYGSGAERIDTQNVLSQLVLPDGRAISFNYNEFGEVAEVVLPTGGRAQYDYAYTPSLPSGNSLFFEVHPTPPRIPSDVHEIDRAVVARRTYADGSTLESSWSYAYGPQTAPNGTYGCAEVQARAANNTLLLDQRHFFMNNGRFLTWNGKEANGTGYSLWSTGLELRSETREAANAVLGASEEDWSQRASVAWSYYTSEQISNDNRVNESRKFLDDGSMAKVQTFYQANVKYNNPTEVKEFDFDQSLKRRTTTTYADSTNLINGLDYTSDSIHLLNLPLVTTVFDGGNGNQAAQSVNEYDNYSSDGNHAPLQDYGSVTQHDTNYGASYTTRGNLTRAGRWLNVTNSFIYSYPRYDDLGNVVAAKDANGNVASISFVDDFGNGSNPGGGASGMIGATYALPTLITSPPPQSGAPAHTARSQYDFSTGLMTGFKDRNGIITQTFYDDAFDRPTQVKSALGISGVESHAAMYYAPATVFGITLTSNDVLMVKDQTSVDDGVLRSWTKTDGFGRTIEGWSKDLQGDVRVVTNFDALGRTKQVSNPFRPSLGETAVYTTSAYDMASRVTSMTTPDSAVVTSAYGGKTVTVTDQAGKQRKSVTDALGRLIQVYEDPAGLNYLTSYSYDTLDNLTGVSQIDPVTQYNQTRTFVYDSLKRLASATNPESGTISYQYDENSNLRFRTDARGISTEYRYDALNRATVKLYRIGGQPDPNTGDVEYLYDNAANGKGRLWLTLTGGANRFQSVVGNYDALGRITQFHNVFGNGQGGWYPSYDINRTYDLAGHVLTETYPSGRTVTNTYDSAGRTSGVTGNLGDGTSRTYATGISYSSFGGITREQYGTTTPLYHKTFYNIRGQMFDTRVSSVNDTWDWNRGRLILYYSSNHAWGQSGPDNNGNVMFAENWVPPPNATLDQAQTLTQDSYTYDALNRLSAVNESSLDIAGGGSWISQFAQVYSYDRYGNRTIDQANTWGTNIPKPNFGVDTNTNRLTPAAGYAMSYDGRRVKRNVNGTETWQVYGPGGELLAEYAANASPSSPQKEYGYRSGELLVTAEPSANIHWLVSDQLGTPRMIFDQTGSLANVSRHDYLPFGEELYVGVGGRTAQQGYGAGDGARQKFTQKERDNETGLDYFLARYYSSTQGRFTSPDPLSAPASGHPNVPQSWNLYSYVLNNPLKLIDPDGLMWIYHYLDDEHKKIGIAWIEGNKISKDLKAQGYRGLNFGGESSGDITLTNGSVVRLSANSGDPLQLRGPQQSNNDGGYVNTGLIRELGRQTAPMPAATGAFILLSLNGGFLIQGSTIAALDAAAFALNAVRETSKNDAAVMATVSQYDQTKGNPGSIRNVYTDVSKSDFIKNMEASGYNVTRQGNVVFLDKGANRYTVYDSPKNGPSAQYFRGGEPVLKIRIKP